MERASSFSYDMLKLVAKAIKASEHMLDVLDGEYPAIKIEHMVHLCIGKGAIIVIGNKDPNERSAKVSVIQTEEQKQRAIHSCSLDRPKHAIRILTWQEVFGKPDLLSSHYELQKRRAEAKKELSNDESAAWSRSVGHAALVDVAWS